MMVTIILPSVLVAWMAISILPGYIAVTEILDIATNKLLLDNKFKFKKIVKFLINFAILTF